MKIKVIEIREAIVDVDETNFSAAEQVAVKAVNQKEVETRIVSYSSYVY